MSVRVETYPAVDIAGISQIRAVLRSGDSDGSLAAPVYLSSAGTTARVPLPNEVRRVVAHVLDAMEQGLAVTVTAQSRMLTSQQAADLLGVSRPTLIKMLDAGDIAFELAGRHRRIPLADLLAFRDARKEAQRRAFDALYEPGDYEDDEPLDVVLARLRDIRRSESKVRLRQKG